MDTQPRHRTGWLFCLMAGLAFLFFLANLVWGSVNVPIAHVWKILTTGQSDNLIYTNIVLRTRMPQAITALGAGMALGIAGLMLQTLFKNPLAGPSVLGISSGASLGVAFVVMVSGQVLGITLTDLTLWGDLAVIAASMCGATTVLVAILAVSRRISGTLGVLIIGVMMGYLSNAVVGIFKYFSYEADVHSYVIWGLGSFNRLSLERALWFGAVAISISLAMLLMTKPLNLIALGDRYAQNLGLNTRRARLAVILGAGLLTAVVNAFCGPIAFIGMAVPHMAKLMCRTSNHLILIVATALTGTATSLLCALVSRMPGLESALPINSVTAFVGAPVVIWVIMKRKGAEQ
ncbi:MAG: iron ABC transporter permease [Breznakibacter sp.]